MGVATALSCTTNGPGPSSRRTLFRNPGQSLRPVLPTEHADEIEDGQTGFLIERALDEAGSRERGDTRDHRGELDTETRN
jgi:hypothetical protein